jgi:hypothetical protein
MNLTEFLLNVRENSIPEFWKKFTRKNYDEQNHFSSIKYEDVIDELQSHHLDIDKVLILEDGNDSNKDQKYYYHPARGVYINIFIDANDSKMINIEKEVIINTAYQKENLASKNYRMYFSQIPWEFRLYEYMNFYPSLSDNEKAGIFDVVYSNY